jgi:hypothetical protein
MHIIKKYPCPVRAMGVVAGGTARFCHRIVHVLLHKRRPVRLMAAYTESDQVIFQEVIRFRRPVRVMAVQTSFFHRTMFKFNFCNTLTNRLMAIETEFVSIFYKNEFMIRGMGIVTFHAMAFGDHFVDAPGFLRYHGLVAVVADLIGVGGKQLPMRGRVRIMTS